MRGGPCWEKIGIKNRAKFQILSLELIEDSGLLLFMLNADTIPLPQERAKDLYSTLASSHQLLGLGSVEMLPLPPIRHT